MKYYREDAIWDNSRALEEVWDTIISSGSITSGLRIREGKDPSMCWQISRRLDITGIVV